MAKTKRATPTGPSLFDLAPQRRITVFEDEGKRKRTETEKPKEEGVCCGDCGHFQRDTSGSSFNVETGIFFMGVSDIGCDPDNTGGKIFAEKPRICETFKPKTT